MTKHKISDSDRERRKKIERMGLDVPDLHRAGGHGYNCTCGACRDWWRHFGPDPHTNKYGPFGDKRP